MSTSVEHSNTDLRRTALKHSKSELREAVDNFNHYTSVAEDGKYVNVYTTTVNGKRLEYRSQFVTENFGTLFKSFFRKEGGKSMYPNDFYFCMKRFARLGKNMDMIPSSFFQMYDFVTYVIDHCPTGISWLIKNGFISTGNTELLKYALNKNASQVFSNLSMAQQRHLVDLDDYFWNYFDTSKQPDILSECFFKHDIMRWFDYNQTVNIIRVYPNMLAYVLEENQTLPLVKEAVMRDGSAIRYAARRFWTPMVCRLALSNNGYALKYLRSAVPRFELAYDDTLTQLALSQAPNMAARLGVDSQVQKSQGRDFDAFLNMMKDSGMNFEHRILEGVSAPPSPSVPPSVPQETPSSSCTIN